MAILLLCAASYLAGSVNFSLLAGHLAGRGDIRRYFSGNPGTTNVYRVLGKWWALGVMALDIGRGLAVSLLAQELFEGPWPVILACLSLLAGNLFPCFHGFRGGKGVATTVGLYLGFDPWATLIAGGLWIFVVASPIGRPSVGSLVLVGAYPILLWALGGAGWLIGLTVVVGGLIVTAHRQNIRRLVRGEEPLMRR